MQTELISLTPRQWASGPHPEPTERNLVAQPYKICNSEGILVIQSHFIFWWEEKSTSVASVEYTKRG